MLYYTTIRAVWFLFGPVFALLGGFQKPSKAVSSREQRKERGRLADTVLATSRTLSPPSVASMPSRSLARRD
jgi:hypothetical protein